MLYRDVVALMGITYSQNDIGDMVESSTTRQVFANKKSIRQTEFYQAAATGLKPEIMFEVRATDYQEESKLVHNGKEYNIIRTYSKNEEILELICAGMVVG